MSENKLTAYQVRNLLNAALKAIGAKGPDGEQRILAGPLVYQYAKAGRIDGQRYEAMTGVTFDQEDADAFVDRYLTKNFGELWAAFKAAQDAKVELFDPSKVLEEDDANQEAELEEQDELQDELQDA